MKWSALGLITPKTAPPKKVRIARYFLFINQMQHKSSR
nr:MAG TPA: hypothetical protein [Caudoviricetes sp.]